MSQILLTHEPILISNAQVLVLPVNSTGLLLDAVLVKSQSLYPDNYKRYRRACQSGNLKAGGCLLYKRELESFGLSTSSNSNQPRFIANLVISDHPYHPPRLEWLTEAIKDLQQQLLPLVRHQGVRKLALLTRPLISTQKPKSAPSALTTLPLDWQTITLPLLKQGLTGVPNLQSVLHLPKSIAITD